ncbi:MAG: hypothetical protein GY811_17890 [Myxococcales bacterium]|nr:hypothetical protein [Myxococcales bacterium]
MPVRIALAIASLSLLACAGGPDENEKIDPDLIADLEIGLSTSGSEGFASAEDGTDVQLASGAQGGFHVWTAPRFRGAAGTLYLDRRARRVSDGTLMLRASRLVIDVPVDAMGDWWRGREAIPSFMCPAPVGLQAYDSEVEFAFDLFSEDEELLATDSLIVVPRCESGEAGKFCRDVCSG